MTTLTKQDVEELGRLTARMRLNHDPQFEVRLGAPWSPGGFETIEVQKGYVDADVARALVQGVVSRPVVVRFFGYLDEPKGDFIVPEVTTPRPLPPPPWALKGDLVEEYREVIETLLRERDPLRCAVCGGHCDADATLIRDLPGSVRVHAACFVALVEDEEEEGEG